MMASRFKVGDRFPAEPGEAPPPFEVDKGNELLTVQPHRDGELFIGCEESHTYDDDGVPHGCITGIWLTRDEAVGLCDYLDKWLAGEEQ